MSEKTLSEIVVEFRGTAVLVSKLSPRKLDPDWNQNGATTPWICYGPQWEKFEFVVSNGAPIVRDVCYGDKLEHTQPLKMKPRGKIILQWMFPMVD